MQNDEIQDIIAQLSRLQVQQTELLPCLGTAADNEVALAGNSEQEEPRAFAIGGNVNVKNPNPFQSNKAR
jgi:hypothetical protein